MKENKKNRKKIVDLELSNITQKWVELLEPFSMDYKNKLYVSELARESKIPQQTASRISDYLAKFNLINFTRKGKNKLFYFDLEKQTTKIILNLIELQKSLKFQLKFDEISITINEILKYCDSLIIFGSYASGNFNKDSDLDIVILGRNNKEMIKAIKQKQIIEINEHYISYKEFAEILKSGNALSIEISRNHIFFGDISKIVGILFNQNE